MAAWLKEWWGVPYFAAAIVCWFVVAAAYVKRDRSGWDDGGRIGLVAITCLVSFAWPLVLLGGPVFLFVERITKPQPKKDDADKRGSYR